MALHHQSIKKNNQLNIQEDAYVGFLFTTIRGKLIPITKNGREKIGLEKVKV